MGGSGCGNGLLDANAAVQHVLNNRPTVTAVLQGSASGVRPGTSFTLVGEVKAAGGRTAAASGMRWRQTAGAPVTIPANAGATVTLTAPSATGPVAFEFVGSDVAGYSASAAVTIPVNAPPVMFTPTVNSVMAGQPLSGSVRGTDPEGDPITYVLVAGPPGLTINASTGAWSWTPASAGTFGVTVMPVDSFGNGTPVNFNISVTADPNKKDDGGGGALSGWLALLLAIPALRRRR
jgi:hypothetical protein